MEKLIPQNEYQEHMVQILLANMQGLPVEYKRGDDWHRAVPDYVSLYTEYRIVSKSTPLPISREMWQLIDNKWKYVAMDGDGEVYFYEHEPTIGTTHDVWSCKTGKCIESAFVIDTEGVDWKMSLTKRPDDI